MTMIPIVIWCVRHGNQRIGKGTEGHGNKKTSRDHPNNIINGTGQNAKQTPGNFRNISVNQTPVRNYQLILVRKTLKRVK